MSFRLSHHAQLPSSGAGISSSQNFQSSQELMPPPLVPPPRARTQQQSFMYDVQSQPRQVDSYASRIRNPQLQSNIQRGYGGGGDPRILRQQR